MRVLVVVVALLVLGMSVPGCSGERDAFSVADDDLCEWVTEDEVAEFVAAEFDWDGTAVLEQSSDGSCGWELTGGWGVSADDAARWEDFDGNPYVVGDRLVEEGIVGFDDAGEVGIGAFVSGHPALSDGVVVHNGGFGQFAFGVPPRSDWLAVSVYANEEDTAWADYEPRLFRRR